MKSFKTIVASIAMAASMAMVSSAAFSAEDHNAKVRAASENTIAKLQEANDLASDAAKNKEAIQAALSAARQSQKEFRFEATERARQNGNNHLTAARDAYDKGDLAAGKEHTAQALTVFSDMKKVYDAAH